MTQLVSRKPWFKYLLNYSDEKKHDSLVCAFCTCSSCFFLWSPDEKKVVVGRRTHADTHGVSRRTCRRADVQLSVKWSPQGLGESWRGRYRDVQPPWLDCNEGGVHRDCRCLRQDYWRSCKDNMPLSVCTLHPLPLLTQKIVYTQSTFAKRIRTSWSR